MANLKGWLTEPKEYPTNPELLLHANIPKPLHGVNPRTIKGKEWWDKTRKEAYAKRGYHCFACGVHVCDAKYYRWLEAHEFYDIDYETGKVTLNEIVALCHSCHSYIHSGLLTIRMETGQITKKMYKEIMQHGQQVLKKAGLKRPTKLCEDMPSWEDWYLEFEGEKYYSPFRDYDAWKKHYEN